jgi:hypothetical protein
MISVFHTDLIWFLTDSHGLVSQIDTDWRASHGFSQIWFLTDSHGLVSQIDTDWRASHGFSQIWFGFSQIDADFQHLETVIYRVAVSCL